VSRTDGSADRLEELVDLVCDGRAGAAEFAELQERLRSDAAARRLYLEMMELHAALRKGRVPSAGLPGVRSREGPRIVRARRAVLALAGLAAAAVVAAFAVRPWFGAGGARNGGAGGAVATVLACENVRWSGAPRDIGSRLFVGESLGLEAGTVGLRFGRDATVTLEGPAEVELRSAMRARAVRGRVTVRVGPESRGFAVETPRAEVVDLGTEFGVQVDDAGRTDVVVFQGAIDLSYGADRGAGAGAGRGPTRLTQGEALRLGLADDLSRIVSVERRPGDTHWSTGAATAEDAVIRRVGDDIRGLGSTKYYQIVPRGLAEDVPAYVDRPHQWNGLDGRGLPEFLRGADYVMPFNVDKHSREIVVTVTLARAATLYVFFDDRAAVPPWLAGQFTDTGWDIGLDEGRSPERDLSTDTGPGRSIDTVFSVWKRTLDGPGSVTLGAMVDTSSGKAMYGIAAKVDDGN
jgi:ferric-dicitrate binding protein FerR (iron transport regulator)